MFHQLGAHSVVMCIFLACHFACVVCGACYVCDCDLCVFVLDRLCVWLAVGVTSAICAVWSVWPCLVSVPHCVRCVYFSGSMVHVHCVQLRARCVGGLLSGVMCCLCVERLHVNSGFECCGGFAFVLSVLCWLFLCVFVAVCAVCSVCVVLCALYCLCGT